MVVVDEALVSWPRCLAIVCLLVNSIKLLLKRSFTLRRMVSIERNRAVALVEIAFETRQSPCKVLIGFNAALFSTAGWILSSRDFVKMAAKTFLTSIAVPKSDDGNYPYEIADWLIPHGK